MSILYTPFTQTKTFFRISYICFDHTNLVTRYSVLYPCTELTICGKKTKFIWVQRENLRKNWNKLISLRRICASQIPQEDYIRFFFFVPHLNVSTSPKLIRWPRAYILIAYILGTPLILTHNRLSIGFSVNASWCRILYVNCDFLQKPQTHFWGIFPLRLWTVLQLKVANPCDLLKQKFLFPKMLCTNRYRERKLRLSIIHVSHSSFISSWEVKSIKYN